MNRALPRLLLPTLVAAAALASAALVSPHSPAVHQKKRAQPALANRLELLAVPGKEAKGMKRELSLLKASPLVKKVSFVFQPEERRALARLGDSAVGNTLRISFASAAKAAAFREWSRNRLHAYKIEANPLIRPAEEPLENLEWGLRNNGGTYSIDLDFFTAKKQRAQAGEDIGLKGAPAGNKSVVVAVLDSGIDRDHPDLQDALVRHPEECKALDEFRSCLGKSGEDACVSKYFIDHDGNGYPLDCNGWNLAREDDSPTTMNQSRPPLSGEILGSPNVNDFTGHGTHVAGIVAARKNGKGVVGVAPNAKILPVRVISGDPSEVIRAQEAGAPAPRESDLHAAFGLGDILARGVLYSIRSGAKVINMSLGFPEPLDSELLRRMLALARAKGILVVAAAGNDSTDSVIFPCRYEGVICVGAHGPDGALTFFSNFGFGVDILAPGWNIVSTYPMDLLPLQFTDRRGYESKDGTSMAAPFVSGMLARMLGLGMSPDEAYARLILGARPTRPSQLENPSLFPLASLSGNADLARALQVEAQPLVLPANKSPVRVEWKKGTRKAELRFSLTNHWVSAKNVAITLAPANGSEFRLSQNSWQVSDWQPQSAKGFSTELEILDDRLNSDLDFTVQVSAANMEARSFPLRAEVVTPIFPSTQADLTVLPLVSRTGEALKRKYDEVQTVSLLTGKGHEYMGVLLKDHAYTLELLREENGRMVLVGSLPRGKETQEVASIQKLPVSGGEPIYVLTESVAQKGAQKTTRFTWLGGNFSPLRGLSPAVIDPTVAVVPDTVQWQKVGSRLMPTWYGFGKLPALDQKAYNPWKPDENEKTDFRMYYWTPKGLRSLALPKSYPKMVSLVPQTPSQVANGSVAVLLAGGEDYLHTYGMFEIRNGRWGNAKKLVLPKYRNIQGLMPSPLVSLDPASSFAGYGFTGFVNAESGPHGNRRTTAVSTRGVLDLTATPLRKLDVVADVVGTFVGAKSASEFSLTKYDIVYTDFTARKAARTTQKRFSFLPMVYSLKSSYPAVAADAENHRIPALFIPGDFFFSKATQVVLPDQGAEGLRLIRPAKFHLEAQEGCTALPKAKDANANGPSELVFFCGDHFAAQSLRF